MDIGLFVDVSSVTIPTGVDSARTSGWDILGLGGANYTVTAVGDHDGVETRTRKLSANNRMVILDEDLVTPLMAGARADYWLADGTVNASPTDDIDAIQHVVDTYEIVFFPNKGQYALDEEDDLEFRPLGGQKTGYYASEPVVLKKGVHLWGKSTLGSSSVASFATAIVSGNDDTVLDLRTNNAQQVTIEGLTLYAPDTTTHLIDVTPLRTTLRDLHLLGGNVGIGGVSGAYGEHSNFYNVHVYGCQVGVRRIRDTRWYGGRVAACKSHGIDLVSGCNDNQLNVKCDFNEGWNIRATDCSDLQIFSEACDRGKLGGVRLSGCKRVSGVINLQRNGSADSGASGEDAHLYLSACEGVALTVTTSTGKEDDGSGSVTPKYALVLDGTANAEVNIFGDLSGATVQSVQLLSNAKLTNVRLLASGDISNYGDVPRYQLQAGASIASSGTTTFTFDLGVLADYGRRPLILRVAARREDSESNSPAVFFPLLVKRGSGSATVEAGTPFGPIDSGDTFFGFAGTENCSLAPSVSADGSTLTIVATSHFATTNLRVSADVN